MPPARRGELFVSAPGCGLVTMQRVYDMSRNRRCSRIVPASIRTVQMSRPVSKLSLGRKPINEQELCLGSLSEL